VKASLTGTPPQVVHLLRGPVGEVGQGHLTDLAAIENGLAHQDGGGKLRLGTTSIYMVHKTQ
jgi:hypothetical protein